MSSFPPDPAGYPMPPPNPHQTMAAVPVSVPDDYSYDHVPQLHHQQQPQILDSGDSLMSLSDTLNHLIQRMCF